MSKHEKEFLAIGLTIGVLMSLLSLPISAMENQTANASSWMSIDIEQEINRALNGKTDLALNAAVPAQAFLVNEDGMKETVEVYTTTRKLENPIMLEASVSEPVYATTTVAVLAMSEDKSDTDSNNDYYVTAYGTIYWRDNFGTDNEFLGALGGWKRDKDPDTGTYPQLTNAKVKLTGITYASDFVAELFYPSSTTYNISASQFEYVRRSYWLDADITVNGSNVLQLRVTTSIFS